MTCCTNEDANGACQFVTIIIICHDILPPCIKRSSHVKSDYSHIIMQDSPLSPFTMHLHIDISSCDNIYSLLQLHDESTSHSSVGNKPSRATDGGGTEFTNKAKMAASHLIIYMCTRAFHSLSFAHFRAASTVNLLLPKKTFTPSIQPNLCLPRTRPQLTSAINIHGLTIWSSVVLVDTFVREKFVSYLL